MKTIQTLAIICSLVMMYTSGTAQNNCPGDKIKVFRGANGCGCNCDKECILPADLPAYLENGWNTVGCWNCCKFRNWVDADQPKTSLDEIHPATEAGSLAISFTLASERHVKLQLSDMTGRSMATIANEFRTDANNELIWDDSALSPGMYLLTLEAGDHRETKVISVME